MNNLEPPPVFASFLLSPDPETFEQMISIYSNSKGSLGHGEPCDTGKKIIKGIVKFWGCLGQNIIFWPPVTRVFVARTKKIQKIFFQIQKKNK